MQLMKKMSNNLTAFMAAACLVFGSSTTALGAMTLDLPGAFTAGLGGTCAAAYGDGGLVLRNPAGLSALKDNRVALETYWVDGTQAYLTSLLQENQNGWSGGLYLMSMNGKGSDNYYDIGYAVAAGPWNGLSLGTTLHYLKGAKSNKSMSGWSVDAGLHQDFGAVKLGVGVRNAWNNGTGIAFSEETQTGIPQEIRAGIALDLKSVEVRLDAIKEQDSDQVLYAAGVSTTVSKATISGGVTSTGDKMSYSLGLSVPFHFNEISTSVKWPGDSNPAVYIGWTYKY